MKSNETTQRIDEAMEYMQNDTAKAIEIFDEILESEPENIEAINGKGSSLMKLNRMREAENHFDYSLSIKQTSSAYINKGLICKGRKEYDQALDFYDKAAEINPDLKNILTILKNEINVLMGREMEISTDYSPEAYGLIKEGMRYRNSNRLWDALDCYEKAIKADESCRDSIQSSINDIKSIFKNELLINTHELGDSRIERMKLKSLRLLLIEKNPYDALTIINLILDDNENDVDALNQKGCILFLFDKCKEALECFNRCLIIDENYHYALFNKAIALRRINELNKSLNCFDELLKTPQNYDKVKPYQLEILDKLHEEAIAEKS
jgi:tetratricopeptide (TPR) repeat protein